ncbi:protein D3-like [Anticarsia gemmatalis]|uniref:protein D3-like n=1 Tax=Anticarsia gemmatalis TaxID=129554 RepID=UPI003F77061B
MAGIIRLFRCAFILLVVDSAMVNLRVFAALQSFIANEIVTDVIPVAPDAVANVLYPSGVEVNEGNVLTPTQVKDRPTVTWEADPDAYYTVAMVDPDVPSRVNRSQGEWQHWIVGNFPGNGEDCGETLSEYVGAGPPAGSGFHRYVFLVYEQPCLLTFDEPRLNNTSMANRPLFSITRFAEKYNLGDPIAGNFFQAEYDDYVPILFAQLGA